MKKLPLILSQVAMYIIIGVGLWRFIEQYKTVAVIDIPPETQTSIPIIPLIVVSVVVFMILLGVGSQLLMMLWSWFMEHKSAIVFPALLIAVGILQLASNLMLAAKMYIETNATQFTNNLDIYAQSFSSLMWYIIIGIIIGAIGIGYNVIQPYLE